MFGTRPLSIVIFAALIAVGAGCNSDTATTPAVVATPTAVPLRAPGTPSNLPVLSVTSTGFTNGSVVPASAPNNGCGGTNVSPQVSWSAGPAGTLSYTLTVFDPDAPTGTGFWHWVVFNIPASTTSFAAGFGTTAPPAPIVEGYTDNGSSGYGGPCPPIGDGPHRYIFTVSALNVATVPGGATAATTGAGLTFRTRGTILAQGTLIGTFSR